MFLSGIVFEKGKKDKFEWNQIITFILTNYKISRIPAAPRISSENTKDRYLGNGFFPGNNKTLSTMNLGLNLEKRKVVSCEKRLGLQYTLKMSHSSLGKIFYSKMIDSRDRIEAKQKSLIMFGVTSVLRCSRSTCRKQLI